MTAAKYLRDPLGAAWIVTNRSRGTRLDGVGRLAGRLLPFRPSQTSGQMFEDQFASGHWNRLEEIEQLSRYSVIAGYCHYHGFGSILDVGCGQGLLERHVPHSPDSRFVGLDVSESAIAMASDGRTNEGSRFSVADLETYEPNQRFDAIIFNESVYYFDEPAELVARYTRYLTDDGVVVVSMFNSIRNDKIWEFFDQSFETVDESIPTHVQTGKSWRIRVMRPATTGPSAIITLN